MNFPHLYGDAILQDSLEGIFLGVFCNLQFSVNRITPLELIESIRERKDFPFSFFFFLIIEPKDFQLNILEKIDVFRFGNILCYYL